MPERIFIGVAWPYANGPLHVGHLAGAYLPADIFARYHRVAGNDVLMVSGSDCYGTPITVRADREGVPPEEIVTRYHTEFLGYWRALGIEFDMYTATRTENHHRVARAFWRNLYERGHVYLRETDLPYDPVRQQFLPDRYVEGTCPICSYPEARGDQCDNCGNTLDAVQLINPRSKLSGATPEIRPARHMFFRLSAFAEPLRAWLETREGWRRNVRASALGWLNEGLLDRGITRDLDWGIPAPFPGFEDKKIYVWYEAVLGYLSAAVQWAAERGETDAWRAYWEDTATRSYYFIGKDNIFFHTIFWPAMLLAHTGLNLPTDVPANQYVTMSGSKASKSRSLGVFLPDYLGRYDPDPLRYYLARNMPETADSDFTWEEFVRKNNDELVATWGNLANRVLTLTARNFEGVVPAEPGADARSREVLALAAATLDETGRQLAAVSIRRAVESNLRLAQEVNRYLDETEPWKSIRHDRPAAAAALSTALTAINVAKLAFWPILPATSEALDRQLGFDGNIRARGWRLEIVPAGQRLGTPAPLFRKLDEAEVLAAAGIADA